MPDTHLDPDDSAAADRAAVAEVIHRETACFRDMDFDGWAACRLHAPRACDISIAPGIGVTVTRGWEAIAAEMAGIVARGRQPCGMVEFRQDNLQITVSGDMAWTTHDGWMRGDDGHDSTTFETRVLERTAGGWRIVLMSFAQRRETGAAPGRVALDARGRLLWSSQETGRLLKQHPALTVSQGRLRARRRDWDKVLQAAIDRAGALHGFFDHRRFVADTGAPFRTPVVLGEDEAGAAVICQLVVTDGLTWLDLDPAADLDRRLAAAQAIFALSPGQTALSARIAAGDSLGDAAAAMGISVNTARTHLARIYDKTGVNAQTALVRLLLSVG